MIKLLIKTNHKTLDYYIFIYNIQIFQSNLHLYIQLSRNIWLNTGFRCVCSTQKGHWEKFIDHFKRPFKANKHGLEISHWKAGTTYPI